MTKLYCFDFDGTLTKTDTMFAFLRFVNPATFVLKFGLHTPAMSMVKMGLAEADMVKKSLISSCIGGMSREQLESKAEEFCEKKFDRIMRQSAVDFVTHTEPQHKKIIVTASLDLWVKPFADRLGCELIATKAKYKNNVFTGKFASPNCNGKEKVRRLEEQVVRSDFDQVIAFGDTPADRPMMAWADKSYFQYFH